jgi:hypothetical protein
VREIPSEKESIGCIETRGAQLQNRPEQTNFSVLFVQAGFCLEKTKTMP